MNPPKTIAELRDRIIADARLAVDRRERDAPEHKRRGYYAGLDLAATLSTPEEFQAVLKERHAKEAQMRFEGINYEEYWEHRCCTAEVEFVWERLRLVWNIGDNFSGNAYLQLARYAGLVPAGGGS